MSAMSAIRFGSLRDMELAAPAPPPRFCGAIACGRRFGAKERARHINVFQQERKRTEVATDLRQGAPMREQFTERADPSIQVIANRQERCLDLEDVHDHIITDLHSTKTSHLVGSTRNHELLLGFTAGGHATSFIDVELGQVCCTRFMACARNKLWWMTPTWGTDMSELATETQFLLLEHAPDGPYSILLPLIDGPFRATLKADRDQNLKLRSNKLILRIESGDDNVKAESWQANLLVASSWQVSELLQRAMGLAAKASGSAKPISQKLLPVSIDYFGWCTWDAFYSSVSAMGIQQGLESLNKGGVRPRTLIIDDGWQLTEVDEDFQEAFSTKALRSLRLPATETIDEDFDVAEQSVLASYADSVGGSSDLATSMPAMADPDIPKQRKAAHDKELRQLDGKQDLKPDIEPVVSAVDDNLKHAVLPDISGTVMQLSKEPKNPTLWSRLVQRLAGWAIGIVQVGCLKFYQNFVDSAPPHSYFIYFWEYLANGPMRWNMLQFFKVSGDFTRRIISIKANGKFADPSASSDARSIAEANDLKRVTDFLRQEFGIGYIYCWHGLPAYWGGVMPNSPELSIYNPRVIFPKPTRGLLEIEPTLRWNPAVLAGVGIVENAAMLYSDMHEYLKEGGVDGVKVDCQAGVGLLGSVEGGGAALAKRYHTALEDSMAKHFKGNHVINCMCHSTENLYQMRDSALVRASDDFYPREVASNLPHIAACAYNSVFLSELAQPDWDMFQSKHPAAHVHACARAVSGGAVYVSDKPGKHDFELLKRLVLRDGSILRALRPGKPTRDCLFVNPLCDGKSLLKVWTNNAVSGFLGIFNLQGSSWDRELRQFRIHDPTPPTLSTKCHPADVETISELQARVPGDPSGRFATFLHRSSQIQLAGLWEAIPVTVSTASADLLTVVPTSLAGGIEFAPIGIGSMLNTGGSVSDWRIGHGSAAAASGRRADNGGGRASNGTNGKDAGGMFHEVEIRGEGGFVAYASQAPHSVLVDGVALADDDVTWDSKTKTVRVNVTAGASAPVSHVLHFQFLPASA